MTAITGDVGTQAAAVHVAVPGSARRASSADRLDRRATSGRVGVASTLSSTDLA